MNGQTKKYNNFMDKTGVYACTPNPYAPPKTLGFSLKKANEYAKRHNLKIADIPLQRLKRL